MSNNTLTELTYLQYQIATVSDNYIDLCNPWGMDEACEKVVFKLRFIRPGVQRLSVPRSEVIHEMFVYRKE